MSLAHRTGGGAAKAPRQKSLKFPKYEHSEERSIVHAGTVLNLKNNFRITADAIPESPIILCHFQLNDNPDESWWLARTNFKTGFRRQCGAPGADAEILNQQAIDEEGASLRLMPELGKSVHYGATEVYHDGNSEYGRHYVALSIYRRSPTKLTWQCYDPNGSTNEPPFTLRDDAIHKLVKRLYSDFTVYKSYEDDQIDTNELEYRTLGLQSITPGQYTAHSSGKYTRGGWCAFYGAAFMWHQSQLRRHDFYVNLRTLKLLLVEYSLVDNRLFGGCANRPGREKYTKRANYSVIPPEWGAGRLGPGPSDENDEAHEYSLLRTRVRGLNNIQNDSTGMNEYTKYWQEKTKPNGILLSVGWNTKSDLGLEHMNFTAEQLGLHGFLLRTMCDKNKEDRHTRDKTWEKELTKTCEAAAALVHDLEKFGLTSVQALKDLDLRAVLDDAEAEVHEGLPPYYEFRPHNPKATTMFMNVMCAFACHDCRLVGSVLVSLGIKNVAHLPSVVPGLKGPRDLDGLECELLKAICDSIENRQVGKSLYSDFNPSDKEYGQIVTAATKCAQFLTTQITTAILTAQRIREKIDAQATTLFRGTVLDAMEIVCTNPDSIPPGSNADLLKSFFKDAGIDTGPSLCPLAPQSSETPRGKPRASRAEMNADAGALAPNLVQNHAFDVIYWTVCHLRKLRKNMVFGMDSAKNNGDTPELRISSHMAALKYVCGQDPEHGISFKPAAGGSAGGSAGGGFAAGLALNSPFKVTPERQSLVDECIEYVKARRGLRSDEALRGRITAGRPAGDVLVWTTLSIEPEEVINMVSDPSKAAIEKIENMAANAQLFLQQDDVQRLFVNNVGKFDVALTDDAGKLVELNWISPRPLFDIWMQSLENIRVAGSVGATPTIMTSGQFFGPDKKVFRSEQKKATNVTVDDLQALYHPNRRYPERIYPDGNLVEYATVQPFFATDSYNYHGGQPFEGHECISHTIWAATAKCDAAKKWSAFHVPMILCELRSNRGATGFVTNPVEELCLVDPRFKRNRTVKYWIAPAKGEQPIESKIGHPPIRPRSPVTLQDFVPFETTTSTRPPPRGAQRLPSIKEYKAALSRTYPDINNYVCSYYNLSNSEELSLFPGRETLRMTLKEFALATRQKVLGRQDEARAIMDDDDDDIIDLTALERGGGAALEGSDSSPPPKKIRARKAYKVRTADLVTSVSMETPHRPPVPYRNGHSFRYPETLRRESKAYQAGTHLIARPAAGHTIVYHGISFPTTADAVNAYWKKETNCHVKYVTPDFSVARSYAICHMDHRYEDEMTTVLSLEVPTKGILGESDMPSEDVGQFIKKAADDIFENFVSGGWAVPGDNGCIDVQTPSDFCDAMFFSYGYMPEGAHDNPTTTQSYIRKFQDLAARYGSGGAGATAKPDSKWLDEITKKSTTARATYLAGLRVTEGVLLRCSLFKVDVAVHRLLLRYAAENYAHDKSIVGISFPPILSWTTPAQELDGAMQEFAWGNFHAETVLNPTGLEAAVEIYAKERSMPSIDDPRMIPRSPSAPDYNALFQTASAPTGGATDVPHLAAIRQPDFDDASSSSSSSDGFTSSDDDDNLQQLKQIASARAKQFRASPNSNPFDLEQTSSGGSGTATVAERKKQLGLETRFSQSCA